MVARISLIWSVFCLGWGSVQAAIPPSQYLVKKWVGKHMPIQGLKMISTVYVENEDHRGTSLNFFEPKQILFSNSKKPNPIWIEAFKEHLILDAASGQLVSQAVDAQGRVLYQFFKKWPTTQAPILFHLLLAATTDSVENALIHSGIPVLKESTLRGMPDETKRRAAEKTHMARFFGKPVWTIGENPAGLNEGSPQLWLEKDSVLPLRLVYREPAQSKWLDFHLDSYRFFREMPYPGQIQLWSEGHPELRVDLSYILLQPEKKLPGRGVSGLTELGQSASSQIRHALEIYYKEFR